MLTTEYCEKCDAHQDHYVLDIKPFLQLEFVQLYTIVVECTACGEIWEYTAEKGEL